MRGAWMGTRFSLLLKLELFSTLMSSIYYSEKINRWWKTRSLNQKVKKDEAVSATTKIVCPEANTESAAPQVKPELPLPVMPTEVEQSILEKPCTDECTHMLTAGDANSDLCLYWFGTWQSLDIQLENLFCRVNMILLRVNKARVQTVGKDIIHFFRVIWVQFIQPLLALLGILICLLQQIQPTVWLWRTELNANLVCYKGHNYPVWDVQSCGTLFGQCFT